VNVEGGGLEPRVYKRNVINNIHMRSASLQSVNQAMDSDSPKEIITQERLRELRDSHPDAYGMLYSFAEEPERFERGRAQINAIWARLPQSMRENRDLQQRVTSPNRDTARGALGELITRELIESFSKSEPSYSPTVRGKTPDFSLLGPGSDLLLVESVALSGPKHEAANFENWLLIKRELAGIDAPFRIVLLDTPDCKIRRNKNGTFHGLKPKVIQVLDQAKSVEPDPQEQFSIEFEGGVIWFNLHLSDRFSIGHHSEGNGEPSRKVLNEALRRKYKNYDDDLVISVINNCSGIHFRLLYDTLIGRRRLVCGHSQNLANRNLNTEWVSDFKGIWGVERSSRDNHLHFAAVLYSELTSDGRDGTFTANTWLIENPVRRGEIAPVFPTLPLVIVEDGWDWDAKPYEWRPGYPPYWVE
jgi:hypothetical protein